MKSRTPQTNRSIYASKKARLKARIKAHARVRTGAARRAKLFRQRFKATNYEDQRLYGDRKKEKTVNRLTALEWQLLNDLTVPELIRLSMFRDAFYII
jgi:hypothetical protein